MVTIKTGASPKEVQKKLSLHEKFSHVKTQIVKKVDSFVSKKELLALVEKLQDSNSVLRLQVSKLNHRLNEVVIANTNLKADKKDLETKYGVLHERYARSQGLWEKAIEKVDENQLDTERVLLGASAMSQKLFKNVNNGFAVISVKKLGIKPFDFSSWEVLYVRNGQLGTKIIERNPEEQEVDVMSKLVDANSISDIEAISIYSQKASKAVL